MFFGVFVCAVGLLLALTMGADKGDKNEWVGGKEAAANEVLVKFRDASFADIENAKRRGGIVQAKKIGGIDVYRFRSSDKNVAALINLFGEEPKVEYVEPNYILYADVTPLDPRYGELWGMAKISAPSAWSIATSSTGVTVGVVDTGVDYTHADLAANVWTAPYAFNVTIGDTTMTCPGGAHGYNAIRGTFDPMDDNNHGTHVSGTIGAVGNNGIGVAGVNWTASIMGLKFLGSRGSGSTADAIDAIEFAIQAKEKGVANVRVLSNSWGGGKSTNAMREEIERAYQNNILFVCSAGNSGAGPVINYYLPTYNVLNLIAVAASDQGDYLAGFSNYGYWSIHLAAPGVNVLSTVRKNSYDFYNGTSMAVPHVSGTAALALSKWPDMNVDKLRSVILNAVDVINEPPPPDYSDTKAKNIYGNVITNGRLNAYKAVSVDPGSVSLFPDYVMLFTPPMRSVVRGKTADYVLTVTSYFGYSEANLKIGLSCCNWSRITIKMEDPSLPGNWINLSQGGVIYLNLSPYQTQDIRMQVETTSNTSASDYGITIFAEDEKETGELGPFLYHNNTAYLTVTRR
jgi:subtilisin family serine protease